MMPHARTMPGALPLVTYPIRFEALTGLCPDNFGQLVEDVRPAVAAAEADKRDRPARVRAPGAGRKHLLALPDRVFTSLLMCRFGPSKAQRVGYLVGVSGDTVRRAAATLFPVLRAAGHSALCRPLTSDERRDRLLVACRDLPDHGGLLRYLALGCGLELAPDGSIGRPGPGSSHPDG